MAIFRPKPSVNPFGFGLKMSHSYQPGTNIAATTELEMLFSLPTYYNRTLLTVTFTGATFLIEAGTITVVLTLSLPQ